MDTSMLCVSFVHMLTKTFENVHLQGVIMLIKMKTIIWIS